MLRALRGCQVVQSCQNQTASLLPTRREGGLRGLSAVFFSKIIILKAFLSRLRRYQQFFFLEFITKKKQKTKSSAFYFPSLFLLRETRLEQWPLRRYSRNVFNCFFVLFYVSMPYKKLVAVGFFCHYFYSPRLFHVGCVANS